MLAEWLHSKDCCRIDNTDKNQAIVDLGICPQTGARMYDLHDRRELYYDDDEIIDVLTGRNRADKDKPNQPKPIWDDIKRATTTPSRPNGIKGSTKLIRQCKCACMKKMKASICSCSICERFKDALRRYHKYQVGWRHQAVEKRKQALIRSMEAGGMPGNEIIQHLNQNPDLVQCSLCSGECHPGSKYQTFSVSPSTCTSALLCVRVHIPPYDLPKLDINFRAIPGETDEFYMHPEACCYGTHVGFNTSAGTTQSYPKCGWDAAFKSMPMHERVVIEESTGEEVKHCIRACPDEYERDGKVIWMDFLKVARGAESTTNNDDDEDWNAGDGVKFQSEWLPVEGSVPQFFEHLLRSLEAYLPHHYEIKLSNRTDRLRERAFIIDPIARDDCPEVFKHVVSEVVDFASDIHAKRAHDTTCSFPETHKCEVHHLTYAPKFVTVDEMEAEHKRTAKTLRKRGVDRVIRPENVVFYCFSKAKGSAAYNQQATANIISIIKTGRLPTGSKSEAFYEQKRILGGDLTSHPALQEGKLAEWENMEPFYPDVKRWYRSRDGCGAQYQGKGAFRGWQTMNQRHGIICEDRRKVTMHGKDIADGDGSAVSGMVRKSFMDDYGLGTRNLVRQLAFKFPAPKTERHTRYYGERGLYASTKYIFMYIPEDAIDEKIVSVEEGYKGSSKDHYYRSLGNSEETSRLFKRRRACVCQPCLKLEDGCILTHGNSDLKAGTTPRATIVKLYTARPTPEARQLRGSRNPTPEFCNSLSARRNVIVRVSNDERANNPNEDYFVAKIEKKALKLNAGGVYSATKYNKNDWIVFVRWYAFVPSKTNEAEDRFYSKGFAQWIPCNSIIKTLENPITLNWEGRYYKLEKKMHDYIELKGDISY